MRIRKWLYPFGIIYGGIMAVRNFLYDAGLLQSTSFPKPVILVGNLSVGGTGKSPHVAYLIELLQSRFKVATLSRGYGRSTKGFLKASSQSTAEDVGDEPLMYHLRFPDVAVYVCEDRRKALHRIMEDDQSPQLVIMDDGFQHRRVEPSFKILLTTFQQPFTNDYMLPAGNLREPRSGYWRADCIIVTGCPNHLTADSQNTLMASLQPLPHQRVFFSSIHYGNPVSFGGQGITDISKSDHCIAFAGIANPASFFQHVQSRCGQFESVSYPDHHAFDRTSLIKWVSGHDSSVVFVTTEKDFVRLKSKGLLDVFNGYHACYIPITIALDPQDAFNQMIMEHLEAFES